MAAASSVVWVILILTTMRPGIRRFPLYLIFGAPFRLCTTSNFVIDSLPLASPLAALKAASLAAYMPGK